MRASRKVLSLAALVGFVALVSACAAQRQAPTAGPAATATPAGPLSARAGGLAGAYLAKRPQAGIVIGIVSGGQRWVRGYGVSAGAGSAAPDGASVYEIGSITKVFTGILLARMVEDGQVGLDDPITRYVPAGTVVAPAAQSITLRQLATHTSGLPRLPANLEATVKDMADPYADYTIENLYASLADVKVARNAGKTSEYSNYGVSLLGQLLAGKAGRPYAELVEEWITAPLGMDDTVLAPSADQQARLVGGRTPQGEPTSPWTFQGAAPAGALRSTADDLLDFIAANLDPAQPVLGRAHTELFAQPQMALGYCWLITTMPDGQIVHWHNGGTGGYVSFLGIDRRRGTGVVVLSNHGDAATGDSSIDELGIELIQAAQSSPLE
ncbi:MAG TPA: serine hydrolase domain-containing protein [Herpetosiphonaceae bacterium]|nr:serine hydrolase domain-containing protein [Herpetosiphonaceae bacterium]